MTGLGKYLKSNIILIVLATGLMVSSCSVEKNTGLSRFYHNLTSNYNIYFNGRQAYLEGMERIRDACDNDYATLIPLFEYSDRDAARAGSAEMERAIVKASKLISLHSMTAKPEMDNNKQLSDREKEFYERKEYNEWVDDSYLLMGKARLVSHELADARVSLLHNIRESHDEQMRNESRIWLARTYLELENYQEANRILTEMELQDSGKDLLAAYYLTLADMHIRQQNYEKALEPLSAALDNIRSKSEKNRPAFILARLYELTGNSTEAAASYKKVLNLNPPYEMEFAARIGRAGVFDVSTGDTREIRKELDKLLRDAKNKEYRDQIYFAHGELSMREGDTEEAIEYFRQSAAISTSNSSQKGRSYLRLAEYYFARPDYHRAKIYYDSTVTFLDENYPGYNEYYNRSLNLDELVSWLDVISRQDSLRYVASLPPSEIDNIINGIIQKVEQEERLANAPQEDRYNMGRFYENQRRFRDNINATGEWYFYNQQALSFGRTEFGNRWGDRELEDNWRRRNKSSTAAVNSPTEGGTDQPEGQGQAPTGIKSKEYYLKNLPMTDSLVIESERMTAEALYNSALIYHEKFSNDDRATEAYTSYLERFPDHYMAARAMYNIYNINKTGDPGLARSYKELLIEKYPESEYAMILSDPGYLEKKSGEAARAEEIYNEAYRAWKNGDYAATIAICSNARDQFPGSDLLPKFMLLEAYAMAPRVSDKDLREKLVLIRDGFPGTEEAGRATGIIASLDKEKPGLKEEEEIEIAGQLYDTLDSPPYRFIIILKDTELDINRLTFDVINYNIDNYTDDNYNSRGEMVDGRYISIAVGNFSNIDSAMAYYHNFNTRTVLDKAGDGEILTFIISSSNFDRFSEDKDAGRYSLFFREKYLK